LLSAIKNLWSTGRQTRFLTDISPKFLAAAILSVKNPIFLETIRIKDGTIDTELINETTLDYKDEIIDYILGAKKGIFRNLTDDVLSVGNAFEKMNTWINDY